MAKLQIDLDVEFHTVGITIRKKGKLTTLMGKEADDRVKKVKVDDLML